MQIQNIGERGFHFVSTAHNISSLHMTDVCIFAKTTALFNYIFIKDKSIIFTVSMKFAILRRRLLKFVNVFSPFRYYLPLEKGVDLHLNKLEKKSFGNVILF